jgi:hypothetical protein
MISAARACATCFAPMCRKSVAMAITGHKRRSAFDHDITSEKDVRDAGATPETHYTRQKGEARGKRWNQQHANIPLSIYQSCSLGA